MLKLNSSFIDVFKTEIASQKISLRKLARLTGLSASTLSDKFGGKSSFSVDDVELISAKLGINIELTRKKD